MSYSRSFSLVSPVAVFLIPSLILTGCYRNAPFTQTVQSSLPHAGYAGSVLQQQKSGESARVAVDIEVHEDSAGSGEIQMHSLDGVSDNVVRYSREGSHRIKIEMPPSTELGTLELERDADCYAKQGEVEARFCLNSDLVMLEIWSSKHSRVFAATGARPAKSNGPAFETPTDYTLSQALALSQDHNFSSRIEFEHMIQARLTARAAHLGLLPHLSINSILAVAAPSLTGLLGVIGDLAPFLLPTRWFQAKTASLMAAAERDAQLLMHADLASEIEGLAYVYERDLEIAHLYESLIDRAMQSRNQVQKLEKAAQMPEGSADHLTATILSMKLDTSALQLLLIEDKAALAQAMGFYNPEAVHSMTLGAESMPIDHATPLDSQPLATAALEYSLELIQMDHLIQAARYQKREQYFGWLDPACSPQQGLGVGLGATVAVGASRVRELQIARELQQQMLIQKSYQAVAEYNQTRLAYPMVAEGLALQEKRMARVLEQVGPGSTLNTLDIESIFQDYLANGIRQAAMIASFRVARAKIERLHFQGHYVFKPTVM